MTGPRGAVSAGACDHCLRRAALVTALAPWIEHARHQRRRLVELLALEDDLLMAAVGGARRPELAAAYAGFDAGAARRRISATGLHAICRHAAGYPAGLRDAHDRPSVLHVAGDATLLTSLSDPGVPAVAVVGARRAGEDSLMVARALGRGLAAAGVTVVSGMALGIDSAAHAGALEVGGPTVAVLAGGADAPYPRSKARLYRALAETQCVTSEMSPGAVARRWCFPARNRIIAGLSRLTVVVEAAERSGSLITADLAQELGRVVGAVPGPVTAPRAAGSNALLRDGAAVIRDAQDALDEALGIGAATATARARPSIARLDPALRALLRRVEDGDDTLAALTRTPDGADAAMAGLGELELLGVLRRIAGGRYVRAW